MSTKTKIGIGECLLLATVLITSSFAYWIVAESDDDKVHSVIKRYDRLYMAERFEEATTLFSDTLSKTGDGPLDPIWIPMVRGNRNGYVQITFYKRILAAEPERESTYQAIANLIEFAPDSFQKEVKQRYLQALLSIPNVRKDYLEKYGLLPEAREPKPAEMVQP